MRPLVGIGTPDGPGQDRYGSAREERARDRGDEFDRRITDETDHGAPSSAMRAATFSARACTSCQGWCDHAPLSVLRTASLVGALVIAADKAAASSVTSSSVRSRRVRQDGRFEIADGLTREQIFLRERHAETVFDGHDSDRERDGVEADVVDQPRLAGDASDVDIHVVTQDFGEGDADRIGGRRLHGEGRYTGQVG